MKEYNKEEKDIFIYPTTPIKLDITHSDFCYASYVVKHRNGEIDYKELQCIAFASNNRTRNLGKTWKSILASGYSSVPDKKELSDKLNDTKSKLARKAFISV